MSKPSVIYGLVDPRDGELRYIGKTVQQLEHRLQGHMLLADRRDQYSRNWLYGLKQLGMKPDIFAIEHCAGEAWREAEMHWIAYFRSIGARLTNHTNGGMGPSGYVRSPETLRRMSLAQRGKVLTPEHRQAISEGLKGRKMRPESTAKSAEYHRGKERPAETRSRMSAARLARGTTARQFESLKNLHVRNTGTKRSVETRLKIAAGVRAARAGLKSIEPIVPVTVAALKRHVLI